VRRLPSVLLLGALALSTTAFAPSLPSSEPAAVTEVGAAAETAATAVAERQIVVCVKFRDWEVPATGVTWEAPYERFCVKAPDVKVPFPGGNPAPEILPGEQA
jgi:hypothetical protein